MGLGLQNQNFQLSDLTKSMEVQLAGKTGLFRQLRQSVKITLAAESKCREHICHFTSDCTYYTEFHEILQSECNSHANFLMITHEWSNIIMECRLILKSFELVSKFSNISNRVNVPRFSCVSAQLKSLLQPSDRRRARHHFRGHFYQSSDPIKPGGNIQFQLHVFSNKFLNFMLQPLLRRGIMFLIS